MNEKDNLRSIIFLLSFLINIFIFIFLLFSNLKWYFSLIVVFLQFLLNLKTFRSSGEHLSYSIASTLFLIFGIKSMTFDLYVTLPIIIFANFGFSEISHNYKHSGLLKIFNKTNYEEEKIIELALDYSYWCGRYDENDYHDSNSYKNHDLEKITEESKEQLMRILEETDEQRKNHLLYAHSKKEKIVEKLSDIKESVERLLNSK